MIIRIVSPLGAALEHYVRALQSVIVASGGEPEVISQVEPSQSQARRTAWILAHYRHIGQAARRCGADDIVISTWPVLGYFDLIVNRIVGRGRVWLVVHDPEPLVRALGHGPVGRLVLRISGSRRVICHSRTAVDALVGQGGAKRSTLLPHPILADPSKRTRPKRAHRVLVIGQYKPDRDLELLSYIGERLSGEADLRVCGRGWPTLQHWTVQEGFLSEERFQNELTAAAVVLIPYRRFFQSGIAIRCLEVGTPFVGPAGSSLGELVGPDTILLQPLEDKESWLRAIRAILGRETVEIEPLADHYLKLCHTRWSEWLAELAVRVAYRRR
jgi:hypothetical protein